MVRVATSTAASEGVTVGRATSELTAAAVGVAVGWVTASAAARVKTVLGRGGRVALRVGLVAAGAGSPVMELSGRPSHQKLTVSMATTTSAVEISHGDFARVDAG
jgi:hypothetical protein